MTALQERETAPPRRRVPRAVREIIYIFLLWLVYTVGSLLAAGRVHTAFRNAHRVWSLERALHLPNEARIQLAMLAEPWLIRSANIFYSTLHFTVTGIFLLWLYRTRPEHYLWARRVLATLTGLALLTYVVFPLAPPRLVAETGMLDYGTMYGPTVYSSSPQHDHLENQFAAMPSAHVGWATLVAIGLIMAGRSRWRWLWLIHPVVTTLVVVGTANHYVLDAVVAWLMLLGTLLVFRPPSWPAARFRLASVRKRGTVSEVGARPGG